MNSAAIQLLYAGGPGSGCRGPNCGRPKGDGGHRYTDRQRQQLIKKYSSKFRKEVPGIVKRDGKHTIDVKQAPKRAIKQTGISSDGYHYTIIKSPRARGDKGKKDPTQSTSHFKGSFVNEANGIVGHDKHTYSDMFISKGRAGMQQHVLVQRDFAKNRLVVHEWVTDQDGWRQSHTVTKFRNFGRGQGILNKKYGIRVKAPKAGWNK